MFRQIISFSNRTTTCTDILLKYIVFLNIISILENKEIQTDNINKIKKYMHKYRLFDNLFLDNINRL